MKVNEWLFDIFCQIGFAQSGFSGAVPLSFTELDAFLRLSGIELSPKESQLLVDMSRDYCSEVNDNRKGRPAPDQSAIGFLKGVLGS